LKRLIKIAEGLSPAASLAAGMFMLALIGLLDYATGSQISFSVFFLIPVMTVTWQAGRKAGLATCLLASIVWLIAEELGDRVYTNELIPFWNAAVRLGFFVTVSLLLTRIRETAALEGELARTDSLTGIANSRHFSEMGRLEIEKARRSGKSLTSVYMDIDNFKRVNDTLGHSQGDELLRFVAQETAGQLRSTDVLARLGGDEFALLLVDTSQEQARVIVERLNRHLTERIQDRGWPAGFSFGVATFTSPPQSVDEMLRGADLLMYQAKKSPDDRMFFKLFDS